MFCQFSCQFGCCLLGQECDSNVGYWQARPAPTLLLSPTICIPALQASSHPVSRVAKKKRLRYFCFNFSYFFCWFFFIILDGISLLVKNPTRANYTNLTLLNQACNCEISLNLEFLNSGTKLTKFQLTNSNCLSVEALWRKTISQLTNYLTDNTVSRTTPAKPAAK